MAVHKSIGKWEYKIATPQNFILKFGTRDYVWEITPHANFGADRFSGRFFPNT